MIWLIAEDEADIRILITTMVQVWGKQAIAYENGQKVWDWLDKFEHGVIPSPLPELILMDIRMPGKKGNEVARRMRTLPQFAAIPIVLMTAFALNEAEKQEMMQADGVDAIIYKPLPDFEELRLLLQNAVKKKQTLPESIPHDSTNPTPNQ